MLLDEIEDPQNFGAILRTAEQFSIDLVVTTQKRSAKDNLTVLRTSSGASQYSKKNNSYKHKQHNIFFEKTWILDIRW